MQEVLGKTAYGEIRAEVSTPIVQITAQYGLLDKVLVAIDDAASGSATEDSSNFTCQTGTAADGLATISSLRQLAAKAGQGSISKISAVFTAGVADSLQLAGLITAENTFAFGYVGASFGIIHGHSGHSETQELTLTTSASGGENATVTVNGTGYTVPLTAGTVQHNAAEVASSLNTQVNNITFTSNDDQVVAQSLLPEPLGAFAFSSATAVGAWVQITLGVDIVFDFIAQSSWNVDNRLTGTMQEILNPTKGNVYQIQFQSLGYGAIKFYVEDSVSGDFVLVHVIEYANTETDTSVTNPTFRIGWVARNTGNTSNITVYGAAASGFVEGVLKSSTPPRAAINEQTAVGATLTNIIALRNRTTFGGAVNRVEIVPLLATLSTQTNKSAFFEIIANPTFSGVDLVYTYVDKATSVTEIATEAATVSGGRLMGALTVVSGASQSLEFNSRLDQLFAAYPGQTFAIAARVSSGAAADMQVTASWNEDV